MFLQLFKDIVKVVHSNVGSWQFHLISQKTMNKCD